MRLATLWMMLIISTTCCGQKYCAGGAPPKNDPDCIPAAISITGDPKTHTTVTRQPDGMVKIKSNPAPLKCGKYERYEPTDCDDPHVYACHASGCIPILHTVTEKEWQELKDHVRELERRICVGTESGALFDCKVKPPLKAKP